MRLCFCLFYPEHRDFLWAYDLDHVSGQIRVTGGKMILSVSNHKGGVGNVKLVIMESKVPKHREFAVKGLIFLSII